MRTTIRTLTSIDVACCNISNSIESIATKIMQRYDVLKYGVKAFQATLICSVVPLELCRCKKLKRPRHRCRIIIQTSSLA